MAKNENKTKVTAKSVDDFIDAVPKETMRDDARALVKLMGRLTKEEARMWGPSIIGFGTYHYKYESGREGDMPRAAFSPRKPNLVIYLLGVFDTQPQLMAKLGTYKSSKGCLYVKRLSDIDMDVLEELVRADMALVKKQYG
jgi:hypothetical protein